MYARVSAKKAKLYDSADYENLLKMGPNEISRKMGEGTYKKDIEELGAKYDGVQLAELALARNLAREMTELCEMAGGDLEKVIEVYLRKYDILTLKRMLRAKKSGEEADIKDYLTPVGGISWEKLNELAEKDYKQIKDSIKFKNSELNYQEHIKNAETIAEVEKSLDQAYYNELNKMSEKIGSNVLKKFISEEAEYEDLKIALRLKKYGINEEQIRDKMLRSKRSRKVDEVMKRDFNKALDYIVTELGLDVEKRLEKVEKAIEVHRLENALRMLHTQPLTLPSILGYVVAKIIEVENLRMLIRAKETGIQNQETIRKQLVMAG